jgi:hypothetical protein
LLVLCWWFEAGLKCDSKRVWKVILSRTQRTFSVTDQGTVFPEPHPLLLKEWLNALL